MGDSGEVSMTEVAAALHLTKDVLHERLMECRTTYKVNLGYCGITTLPNGLVPLIQKFNPHIVELELSSNSLSDLPADIGKLQHLRVLRLKYNVFRKLPAVIKQLPQLMTLELSGNQIVKLDDGLLMACGQLKELDVSGNLLTELSPNIIHVQKLEVLKAAGNRLDEVPEAIGDAPSLIKIDISTNNLRHLPVSMGRFKKIQRIDVSNNLLRRVPPSIGQLKFLKELNVRYNNLDARYRAKVEEGLSKFLAFLREEEERERLEEIERLKPIGTQVGSYLEYRCKADVSQKLKTEWGAEIQVDNRPFIRNGFTLTQAGKNFYLFGGIIVKDGTVTNDLFWACMDRLDWHNQPTQGEKPPGRYGHCTSFDAAKNRLYVFGGRGSNRKRLNDFYVLDCTTWKWTRQPCTGVPPSPREGCSAVVWHGQFMVFGGRTAAGRSNDLFALDLTKWQWSQPPTSGSVPSPRQSAAVYVDGNKMFVQGGRNNFVLSDLSVLDWEDKVWTGIDVQGPPPSPCYDHVATTHAGYLYIFGGTTELGTQSLGMYRFRIPADVPPVQWREGWEECDTELSFNKLRVPSLAHGQIGAFQLGSVTYGKVNDEDAEKGLVFWDVFVQAPLDALSTKQRTNDDHQAGRAKEKRLETTINMATKMPRSFTVNGVRESALLAYVRDYKRTFEELYPHRRPLYLLPKNECNVPKFVCTTIRPTQTYFSDLYNWQRCCQVIADLMVYEPLGNPLHPPEYLASPASVLGWQAGDAFDIAVVLASLLIGVGYDAYVVMGYAPLSVTLNDQTKSTCPQLLEDKQAQRAAEGEAKLEEETGAKAAAPLPGADTPKYQVTRSYGRTSRYDAAQAAKKAAAAPAAELADGSLSSHRASSTGTGSKPSSAQPPAPPPPAPSPANLVHAWIALLPGKRDITEATFVEPSTGQSYPVAASPYTGIEFMWNHENYWVCMQQPEPHSDARAAPANVSFDLTDATKWEPVLEVPFSGGADAGGDAGTVGDNTGRGNSARGSQAVTPGGRAPGSAAGGRRTGLSTSMSMAVRSNRGGTPKGNDGGGPTTPGGHHTPPGTGFGEGLPLDSGLGEEQVFVPDMPPSWVTKLKIPQDVLDMRCPKGVKVIQYYKTVHELFATFGECARWDGLVEKITLYEDETCLVPVEVREYFARRKDKLAERRSYPLKDTVSETFLKGSAFNISDILTVKGDRRIMNFYHEARLDGLVTREEKIGHKTIERFKNRDDRMVYRSARYDFAGYQTAMAAAEEEAAAAAHAAEQAPPASDLDAPATKVPLVPLIKITEKYDRDPAASVASDDELARRVFLMEDDTIKLTFHFGDNRVSASTKTFKKDGSCLVVQSNPLADPIPNEQLVEELHQLLRAEKASINSVRESEWEVREILKTRIAQEQAITLKTPYFDIVRIKAEESDEEVEEEDGEQAYDYLMPFLPPGMTGMSITLSREQALDVREKCLKSLKDRLIERANIIQARLDEETTALSKKQASYARDKEQLTPAEEEEYERAFEDFQFRIAILDKRLKRHEEQALQKYYDLDKKLRADPRLRLLVHPG